ncbi:MAG: protein kinase, partial [Planctomycetaceae bacterium]|nr:protein kinase [Planctomycetaceae bacterium]
AARLNHRNIVAALDAREDQEIHYLVTEYVEGQDLERIVRQQGPLPLKPALEAILQAARGLEFAHAQGIIHRDIKPANLFRDINGIVKILDMGLARFDDATEAQHDSLTKTGMVMGTAHFMAPEQARDTRRADARSDIYSLGCTLYYLLIGKVPFAGETTIDTILSHVNRPAPSLRETANLPAVVDALFQKMVAKDPQDRFQSAAELIAAIKSLSVKPTSSATHSKPAQPLPPTVLAPVEPEPATPNSRTLLPLIVGTLSFLIVGIPTYLYFSSPLQEPTTPSPPPPQQPTPITQQSTPPQSQPTQTQSTQSQPTPEQPPQPASPSGNYSLEFDGHSSYAHVPDLHPLAGENYTIEVIARVRGVTVANVVSWLGPDWMSLFVNGEGWGVGRKFNGRSYLITTGRPPDLNQTHHVAATYDGSNLKLFIDGRLADTSPTQFDILDARGGLYIGGLDRNDLDEIRYFDGYVDLVRITRGLRYTSDFSPPTSLVHDDTTLALFPFNEGRGSTTQSLDPTPHTATLTNTTWHQE